MSPPSVAINIDSDEPSRVEVMTLRAQADAPEQQFLVCYCGMSVSIMPSGTDMQCAAWAMLLAEQLVEAVNIIKRRLAPETLPLAVRPTHRESDEPGPLPVRMPPEGVES